MEEFIKRNESNKSSNKEFEKLLSQDLGERKFNQLYRSAYYKQKYCIINCLIKFVHFSDRITGCSVVELDFIQSPATSGPARIDLAQLEKLQVITFSNTCECTMRALNFSKD